jgi:glycosyltransferase involved in cell wall biosynthesis
MTDDISIYIPVFNGEKTIIDCLKSIFKQTLKPKKILIINDNSTDNTKKILEKYLDKIEIINDAKNQGVSYSRNLAVNYLKTKYIAI